MAFSPTDDELIIGASDNTITRWTSDGRARGEPEELSSAPVNIQVCGHADAVVVRSTYAIWALDHPRLRQLGAVTESWNVDDCDPNGVWLALGSGKGSVVLQSIAASWSLPLYHATSPIRWLAFAPDGRELAIVADGRLVIKRVPSSVHNAPGELATDGEVHVRIVAANEAGYSSDGRWLAVTCDNGDIWFYRRASGQWRYRSIGASRIVSGAFSPDATQFATADVTGHVPQFDMTTGAFHEPMR